MGDGVDGELHEGIVGSPDGATGGNVATTGGNDAASSPGATSGPTSGPDAASGSDATVRPDAARKPASGQPAAKRGPGRPPKSGSSAAGRDKGQQGRPDAEAVRLRVDQAARPPKREAASKPKPAAPGEDGNAQATTTAILQLAELAGMATLGPVARIAPMEKALIEPAMVRILSRMDAAAVARYSALSDPLLLGMGLTMYGFRIWASARAAQIPDRASDRAPAAGGAAGAAASSPAPVVVAGPPPAETTSSRAAAKNGVAPAPIEILTGIESHQLGGYEG